MFGSRKGFTTVVDIEDFKTITWSYLTNVKMLWEYQGIAYLFREHGIPLYGYECGTMKMNHPVVGIVIPASRDKNYGVNIYVPADMKKKAAKLIADSDKVKESAELEALEGQPHYDAFETEARAAKARNAARKKQHRRELLGSFVRAFSWKC